MQTRLLQPLLFLTTLVIPFLVARPDSLPVIAEMPLGFHAADVVADPARGLLYASDASGKELIRIRLEDGARLNSLTFTNLPDQLRVIPGGSQLWVALLARPHDSNWATGQTGQIGIIDLESFTLIQILDVSIDPYDVLPTGQSTLVITSGSGQWTYLQTAEAATGRSLLDVSGGIRERSRLLLAPEGNRLYFYSDNLLERLDLDPGTRTFRRPAPPVYWSAAGAVGPTCVLDTNRNRLIAASGRLFAASPLPQQDLVDQGFWADTSATDIAIDPLRPALFALRGLTDGTLTYYHAESFQPVSEYRVSAWPRKLLPCADELVVLADATYLGPTVVQRLVNPAVGAETNHPPLPALVLLPSAPTTRGLTVLDATGTTDDQLPSAPLTYEWDWEGDGRWDTAPSTNALATHRFWLAGAQTVVLRVTDRFGAVSELRQELTVPAEPDPGEAAAAGPSFRLPFAAADAAFDLRRPRLFATDPTNRAVVWMDLTSGLSEKRWLFDYPPEHLTVTPDGRRLYATILRYPHTYAPDPGEGYLAEFDLENDALVRTIRVGIDPWSVQATDDGWLLVSGGSAQTTSLDVYRADTAVLSDRRNSVYMRSNLSGAPALELFYLADTGLSPSKMYRFRLDRAQGKISDWLTFPYHGDYEVSGRAYPLPDASRVLTRAGHVFQADDLTFLQTLAFPNAKPVEALLALTNAVVLAHAQILHYLDPVSLAPLTSVTQQYAASFLGAQGDFHYAVAVVNGTNTGVFRRRLPSTDPANNLAPAVRFRSPTNGAAFAEGAQLKFEVEAADEDGTVTNLAYAIDGALRPASSPTATSLYWIGNQPGPHLLTVVATDNLGATNPAAELNFRIAARPEIAFLAPAEPAVFDPPAEIHLEVEAIDPDGSISRVEFYGENPTNGPRLHLGTRTTAPWSLVLSNQTVSRVCYAVAYDTDELASPEISRYLHLRGALGDDFYNPFVWAGTTAESEAANTRATAQRYEPPHAFRTPSHSLWWRWTAPRDLAVTLSTVGSTFDTVIAIYQGTNLGAVVPLYANDDASASTLTSRLKFPAVQGSTYFIAVDAFGSPGMVRLHLTTEDSVTGAPANDAFSNRQGVSGTAWIIEASNAQATLESWETPRYAGTPLGNSVWWEWTAPAAGTATLSTAGSAFDTVLLVYAGPTATVPGLPLAWNDDSLGEDGTSQTIFTTAATVPYYFCVAGWGAASGDLQLALQFEASAPGSAPWNDDFTNAFVIEGDLFSAYGTTLNATHEPLEPAHLGHAGDSVWWRWRATHTGPVIVSTRPLSEGAAPPCLVYLGSDLANLHRPSSFQATAKSGRYEFEALPGMDYALVVWTPFPPGQPFALSLDARASTPPPDLKLTALDADGWLQLQFLAEGSHSAALEISKDLVHWQPLGTNSIAAGAFLKPPASSEAIGFYRLRLLD